jgi:hypothetical protein
LRDDRSKKRLALTASDQLSRDGAARPTNIGSATLFLSISEPLRAMKSRI